MFYVSEIQTEAPCRVQTQLQKKVYFTLLKMQISFKRVVTDVSFTNEDFVAID